ncbi:MAG: UDP-N-acetylglucosamine 1-carboxyvinyltransferase [Verrucomicrobiota bacterium]|nr:UDP-N-acetylglucosamine 1-carboxyvinyltransferase [Verrucomicrobiota bacterium]
MDTFIIQGGVPLHGEIPISGAKNAVLPILAATLLTSEPCVIRRVPDLSDVHFMGKILRSLGASFTFENGTVKVHAKRVRDKGDYDLIRKMRGSICILGPLLARKGKANVSMPGGCVIGTRPIDLHLKGLRALSAKLDIKEGYIQAKSRKLQGNEIFLGGRVGPTVLGTANIMMAATLAEGVTIIESAACEPEVVDLAHFLISMGAKIQGAGTPRIVVTGAEELHGAEHDVIPDRIEAATYAIAAAATNGEVTLTDMRCDHLAAVLDKMREAGVRFEARGSSLKILPGGEIHAVDVSTQPYTGFPTDAQAQLMTLMLRAQGLSIITERIFESRFMHANELARLGADIAIEGPSAIIRGGKELSGAEVMASDLRASAALVIAGLMCSGRTQVNRIYHLDRGYEVMDKKLRKLGARVKRTKEK